MITGRDTTLSTLRNFDIARRSAELRLDYRPTDDLTAIVSIGHNQSENIELTGIGAGGTEDWTYNYLQTRILYGDWFAQYYRNMSDAGTTTIYRTGNPIVDESTLDVFQLQHSAYLGARQRFTYGVDGLLTRPQTDGTLSRVSTATTDSSRRTQLLEFISSDHERFSTLKGPSRTRLILC